MVEFVVQWCEFRAMACTAKSAPQSGCNKGRCLGVTVRTKRLLASFYRFARNDTPKAS
ncbi:hypothetical protein DFP91_2893 [Pseudorhodoplanes sinuspersici]|nr:hypothetical protein DFP91_2893 [Pseudorhodoplanes sinuspersici]